MTNFNEPPDSGDLGAGSENSANQGPSPSPLKNVAAKKGPKLARSRKKNAVTITNKVTNKVSTGKKTAGAKNAG